MFNDLFIVFDIDVLTVIKVFIMCVIAKLKCIIKTPI